MTVCGRSKKYVPAISGPIINALDIIVLVGELVVFFKKVRKRKVGEQSTSRVCR